MTDIVERLCRIELWQYDQDSGDSWQSDLGKEAADEIKRLRAFVAELTADCPICHGRGCPPIGCGRALEQKP